MSTAVVFVYLLISNLYLAYADDSDPAEKSSSTDDAATPTDLPTSSDPPSSVDVHDFGTMLSAASSVAIQAAKREVDNETIAKDTALAAYQELATPSVMLKLNQGARRCALAAMASSLDQGGMPKAEFLDAFSTALKADISSIIENAQSAAEVVYRADDTVAKVVAEAFMNSVVGSAQAYLKQLLLGRTKFTRCQTCQTFLYFKCYWQWICYGFSD